MDKSARSKFPKRAFKPYFGSRSDAARWMRDTLRIQIIEGTQNIQINSDHSLPDEQILSTSYGVSRNVVREALDLLRKEGLIERIPGMGTITTGAKLGQKLDQLRGLAESFDGDHISVTNKVLANREIPATSLIAHKLGIEDGCEVVFVERLRIVDDLPISLDDSYLKTDMAQALLEADLYNKDLFTLLEELQHTSLGWAEVTIESVAADQFSANLLQIPVGSPLLLVQRLIHFEDGTPLDLEVIRYRGDRFYLSSVIRRHQDPNVRRSEIRPYE